MKKFLIGALVLVAVIAMVKTVPDKKAHKNAMMEAVKEYVDEEAAKRGIGDGVLAKLGKGIVNKTIQSVEELHVVVKHRISVVQFLDESIFEQRLDLNLFFFFVFQRGQISFKTFFHKKIRLGAFWCRATTNFAKLFVKHFPHGVFIGNVYRQRNMAVA